jgi:FkbM family methyltransferase
MVLAPPGRYPSPDLVADRYESGTTRLFKELLKPGMVVIDIGAHVGFFTLLAARQVGPTGKVYAFEPEPANHLLLLRNIELNGYTNILAQRKAVSSNSGPTDLFLSALDSGSHSIHPACARGVTGTARVEATTLDAFLDAEGWPQVDLVKIDVEGAEGAVLEGMSRLLDRRRDLKLVVEFCPLLLQLLGVLPSALLDKLASLGFTVHVIDDRRGVLPAEATNMSSLTDDLLKQERYVNLFCSRE